MDKTNARPVNLDLSTVQFPITAIASILHRVCAVISWVAMGFLLIIACHASSSSENFQIISNLFGSHFLMQFIAWGFLSAFGYYCMGTVKHLIQDFGFCETFTGGKAISWAAIVLGFVLSILAGVLIWV